MTCTHRRRSLGLDRLALVHGRLALVRDKLELAGTLVQLVVHSTLACCRFVLDSSCHIECDGPMMERDTLDRLERDKLELADKLALGGKLVLADDRLELADGKLEARSLRLGSLAGRMGLRQPMQCRQWQQWQQWQSIIQV